MKSKDSSTNIRMTAIDVKALLSRILGVLEGENGTKRLILALYRLEEKRFLYFNEAFKKMVGCKSEKLFEQGWDYWFSNIACHESLMVKSRIRYFLSESILRRPMALKYPIYDSNHKIIFVRHEVVLYDLEDCTLAINYLFDISEKERVERALKPKQSLSLDKVSDLEQSISCREKEVLTLIGEGYSSKQIADMLYISNHTAISHRKNLIEKFRVRNTAQLIKNASQVMEL